MLQPPQSDELENYHCWLIKIIYYSVSYESMIYKYFHSFQTVSLHTLLWTIWNKACFYAQITEAILCL